MESAPPSEGLEASLLRRWFPQSAAGISTLQQHERFSETDLRDISDVLRRVGKGAWSRIPRVYAVLRLMDRLDAIDLFLAQSISDVYFPFSHQTLPQSLNPSVAQGFLQVQRVVLSSALDLERETGRHRHFASAADVPFIKVEDLGKGTYGFVDRVISTISHKEYARKLIPRGRTFRRDQRILRDFERELGALKKLRHHRHIVQLIGSYTDPRFVGIVMSPIAECDLKEFLNNCVSDGKANPHSPKSFTRSFFGCLTSALCYLHDSTIRHKDIKPQNVLVSQHTVYLTDFGISLDWSEVGQSTTTGPTPKTARYCAPEVSDYAPRNTSSDLWSLGCIFLEIWTVLKGETIANLHAFLEANGSMSSCYHVNSEATFAWIKRLELKATPADNPPIDWMRHLLVEEKGKRWTARQLLSEIESVNSNPEVKFAFSGQCCMEELESAESVVSSTGSLHESSVTGLVARQSPSTSTATIELAGEERLKAQFGPVPTSSSSPLKTAASSRSSNVTSNSKTIKPLSDRTPMTEDSIKGPSSSSELALEGTPNSEEGVPLDVPELREFAQWMQKRIDDSGRPQSSHPEITPASQHHAETRLPSLASLETGEPPSSSSDVLETSAADMIAELAFDLAARNEKRSSGQFDVESNMRADERGEQISDHAPHASEKTATNTTDEESMLSHDHMSYRPEGDSISTAPEYPVQPTKDSSHKSPNSSYVASPSAQYEWNTPERGNSNSIFGIQKLSRCSQAAASSSHGIPAHAHVMQPDESTLELDTQARDDLSVSSGEQDISTIEDSIAPTHGPSKADATRPAEDREEVTLQPLEKSEEVEYGTSKPSTSTGPTEIGDVLPSRPTAPFIGSSRNQGWPADVPRNDTLLDAHRQTPASKSDEDSAHLQSTPLEGNTPTTKICAKCREPLTGRYVRALSQTFHLECFRCADCGKIVASSFFPVPGKIIGGKFLPITNPPEEHSEEVPLCETDHFRRLDLLCHTCGGALRDFYVTALNRKYHAQHFVCNDPSCDKVFGRSDYYYEHEGKLFCKHHYALRGDICDGCGAAIFKPFVRTHRNGKDKTWHPYCYLIHKYWNVRFKNEFADFFARRDAPEQDGLVLSHDIVDASLNKTEELLDRIWNVVSKFEESCATSVSDMLLHTSNGCLFDALSSAAYLVVKVEQLFVALDSLDQKKLALGSTRVRMSREQKLLCKKLVAWFILITQYVDKPRRGVTQELLSLLTGLAHYLKLLIRIGLRGLISLDPYDKQGDISGFLDKVETTDQTSFQTALQEKLRSSDYISRNADICAACETSVEINPKQGCYWTRSQIYHFDCVSCPNCDAAPKLTNTDTGDSWVECSRCSYVYHNFFKECFILRTSFLLSTHLLMVAWARLAATLKPDAGLMELILPERSLGAGVSAKTQERGAGDDEIPPSRTCPSGWKAYLSAPAKKYMYTKLETGVSQRNFPTSGEPPSTEIPTRIHQEMMSSKAASSNGAQGPRQAMSRDDLESRSSFLLDDIPHIVAAEQTRENPTSNAAESSDNARGSNDPIFATTRMDPVTRRLELSHDDLRSPDELPQIVVSLSESAPQPREGAEKKKKKRGSFLDKLRERSDGSSTNHRGGLRSGPMQGERPKSLPWAVARRSC